MRLKCARHNLQCAVEFLSALFGHAADPLILLEQQPAILIQKAELAGTCQFTAKLAIFDDCIRAALINFYFTIILQKQCRGLILLQKFIPLCCTYPEAVLPPRLDTQQFFIKPAV